MAYALGHSLVGRLRPYSPAHRLRASLLEKDGDFRRPSRSRRPRIG